MQNIDSRNSIMKDLAPRADGILLGDKPYSQSLSLHDVMLQNGCYEAYAASKAGATTTTIQPTDEPATEPDPVPIHKTKEWEYLQRLTGSFIHMPPVILRGMLACIGVSGDADLDCQTPSELVDALFAELVRRSSPNPVTNGTPRNVERDILNIQSLVWMYETTSWIKNASGLSSNEINIPRPDVVDRFTAISTIVKVLDKNKILRLARSLGCMVIGYGQAELTHELLLNIAFHAMELECDLVEILHVVQPYHSASHHSIVVA